MIQTVKSRFSTSELNWRNALKIYGGRNLHFILRHTIWHAQEIHFEMETNCHSIDDVNLTL